MPFGLISDVHANLEALQAVVQAAGPVDRWICLGDTVGYGPRPNECVDWVRDHCDIVLIGNHDLAAIEQLDIRWFNPYAREAALWTRRELTEENRAYLESLPETSVREDWDITFSHGSLTDPPRDYILNRRDARVNFRLLQTQVLFIGHSHLSHCFVSPDASSDCDEQTFEGSAAVTFRPGSRFIVNCGSVGQPRDGDARAAFGLLYPEERRVDVRRVTYDIPAVQKEMRDAGLPPLLAQRLAKGY